MRLQELIQTVLSNDFDGKFEVNGEDVTNLVAEALRNLQYGEELGRYFDIHNPVRNKCVNCGVMYVTKFGTQELCYVCGKEEHDKRNEQRKAALPYQKHEKKRQKGKEWHPIG